jgi:tRNA (guanine-N7-)-methyltransferase
LADRQRGIKSYVLRQGRLTPGQSNALAQQWPVVGLSSEDGLIDPAQHFGNAAPVTLEIGFGMGDSLLKQAEENPGRNFIGIEVHRPGVGHLLIGISEMSLSNVRVFSEDSLDVLAGAIPDNTLDCVQLFFPDPWHKKRHHKRRIVNTVFLSLLKRKLESGGIFHMATDWVPYAEEVKALLNADADLEWIAAPVRPTTKFEARGERLGHTITDLAVRFNPLTSADQ